MEEYEKINSKKGFFGESTIRSLTSLLFADTEAQSQFFTRLFWFSPGFCLGTQLRVMLDRPLTADLIRTSKILSISCNGLPTKT